MFDMSQHSDGHHASESIRPHAGLQENHPHLMVMQSSNDLDNIERHNNSMHNINGNNLSEDDIVQNLSYHESAADIIDSPNISNEPNNVNVQSLQRTVTEL